MLGAVIFDFDGVITDSEILHFRAFNEALKDFGVELTKKEYYSRYLGLSDIDCFKTLIEESRLGLPVKDVPELLARKKVIFERIAKTDGRTIEGVRSFIEMLEENRVPKAICSGALLTEIEFLLEDANLRGFFGVIVSAEHIARGKPHPDGFLLSLERLNESRATSIDPGQCVVIEDSHWGLQAAKAAGMHTVAVTNTYDAEQLSKAERIVHRLDELSMEDLQHLCT